MILDLILGVDNLITQSEGMMRPNYSRSCPNSSILTLYLVYTIELVNGRFELVRIASVG